MHSHFAEEALKAMGGDIPLMINLVSKRTRQLDKGSPPLIRVHPRWGLADIAFQEIIAGKIQAEEGSVENVLEI